MGNECYGKERVVNMGNECYEKMIKINLPLSTCQTCGRTMERSCPSKVIKFRNNSKRFFGECSGKIRETFLTASPLKSYDVSLQQITYQDLTVDDSLKIEKKYKNSISIRNKFAQVLNYKKEDKIKAWSDGPPLINTDEENGSGIEHGFLAAVRIAHSHHIPLCLSPDHFWTLIIQGLGEHIKLHYNELKSKFVNFHIHKKLTVERVKSNDFFREPAKKDDASKPKLFQEFSDFVRERIGEKNYDALIPEFSTTTSRSRIVHELSIMNAMKKYLTLNVQTVCGISKVRLLGTLEDWKKLKSATESLIQYELEWWITNLLEILDKIIKEYQGEETDKNFWKYIYKFYPGKNSNDSNMINGWILNFFPYFSKYRNMYTRRSLQETIDQMESYQEGIEKRGSLDGRRNSMSFVDDFQLLSACTGINITHFTWKDKKKYKMISGFSGATITTSNYVMPVLSWAISE